MSVMRFVQRGDSYCVTFAYDARLVELLKATVPHYSRSWNAHRREWLVDAVYARELADVVTRCGHVVVGITSRSDDVTCWARLLFKRVGRTRSDQVYRALSKCLHPDVGGDTELQRELNEAHAQIQQLKGDTQ